MWYGGVLCGEVDEGVEVMEWDGTNDEGGEHEDVAHEGEEGVQGELGSVLAMVEGVVHISASGHHHYCIEVHLP